MNDKLKGLVDSVLALSKSISALPDMEGYDREMIYDLLDYMMFLSASDGVIAPEEVEAIGDYVGVKFTPEQAKKYLGENDISSDSFRHKVPGSIVRLVEVDNHLRASDTPPAEDASEILLALYKGIGGELINSDGDVHINEETDMYICLTTIDKYLSDNLSSRKNRADHSSAETVAAPEKK